MPVNPFGRQLTTLLVARPLTLCRRVLQAVARGTRIALQRLLSHKPRLEPTRLPVLGAKLRSGITPRPAQEEQARSTPLVVRDHVLRLVRPGHAGFVNTLPQEGVKAHTGPQPGFTPQLEPAPGEVQAPDAEIKR
jgi:hypothetical protein